MTAPTRVLIADDHLIVREGLRLILETSEDMLVVGEAANGQEVLDQVPLSHPTVILLDLRMPHMDGFETLVHLQREWPEVAVIILTTFDEDALLARAMRAGVRGYLVKDTDRETLLAAIRVAARGEMLLQPAQLARLMLRHDPATPTADLTPREIEVLACVAHGERNKEIARSLGISERSVKAHLESIFLKLQVDSRAAAVAFATQQGWI